MDREDMFMAALVTGAVLGLGMLFYFGITSDIEKRELFMSECQADHKRYECEAMWRAGENHSTVTPVPIVVSR